MRFYLGTHEPSWLRYAPFRLFISRRRLGRLKGEWPRACSPWAMDSGAFGVLRKTGRWDITAREYVAIVRRARDEIGMLEWAAQMDTMCEPEILRRTGLTVAAHQAATIDNYIELRTLGADLPIVASVQGWHLDDYLRCRDRYAARGIDLASHDLVGLGSVCRRQATREINAIVATLSMQGLRLHGFGVKTRGLAQYGPDLVSADSLAWSTRGRQMPGCGIGRHQSEANCYAFACSRRAALLAYAEGPSSLWSPAGA